MTIDTCPIMAAAEAASTRGLPSVTRRAVVARNAGWPMRNSFVLGRAGRTRSSRARMACSMEDGLTANEDVFPVRTIYTRPTAATSAAATACHINTGLTASLTMDLSIPSPGLRRW
ncbi:MAG: hypothetical protein BWY85_02344 [Firmicutes bacterium ADurb.Bin506]|nr:MAG: hypothetical protein BWY85_02344 [Firmicutes bacterium ADurb.Bin506]